MNIHEGKGKRKKRKEREETNYIYLLCRKIAGATPAGAARATSGSGAKSKKGKRRNDGKPAVFTKQTFPTFNSVKTPLHRGRGGKKGGTKVSPAKRGRGRLYIYTFAHDHQGNRKREP